MKNGKQGEGGGKTKVVFNDDQIEQVEKLASLLTKGQLCDYLGISEPTFRAIEKRQEEVSFAYKKGKAKAIVTVGSNLIKQAQKGNMTAAIFYLKTQAGWKEEQPEAQEIPPINIIVDGNATHAPTE